MPRHPDAFDYDDAMEQGSDPQPVTCRRCGARGLHWQRVTAADGRSERPVLFTEGMCRHVCPPNPHDFD